MDGQNLNEGHRARLREEFLKTNEEALPDYKLLEMLLFYGIPRKDTRQIAKVLLSKFGSLAGVLEATTDELVAVNGVTSNAACLIKLVLPLAKRCIEGNSGRERIIRSYVEIGEFVLEQYFAEKGETEDQKELWNSQIENLRRQSGM